jgi:UDP-N-acetyl-D-mannosaminuronic acid dehydrogenase
VDDLRESPAVEIVRELVSAGVGEVLVCEPNIESSEEFTLVPQAEALERADLVVVLVDHRPFRRIPREALHEKVLIDTRGVFL